MSGAHCRMSGTQGLRIPAFPTVSYRRECRGCCLFLENLRGTGRRYPEIETLRGCSDVDRLSLKIIVTGSRSRSCVSRGIVADYRADAVMSRIRAEILVERQIICAARSAACSGI